MKTSPPWRRKKKCSCCIQCQEMFLTLLTRKIEKWWFKGKHCQKRERSVCVNKRIILSNYLAICIYWTVYIFPTRSVLSFTLIKACFFYWVWCSWGGWIISIVLAFYVLCCLLFLFLDVNWLTLEQLCFILSPT